MPAPTALSAAVEHAPHQAQVGTMNVSVFDLFKLGIGPSSSHTMGPMTAACRFLVRLKAEGLLDRVERMEVTLYASLALTGRGHATDRAVILGLAGFEPRTLDPDRADALIDQVRTAHKLRLAGEREIAFDEARDLIWEGRTRLPQHPNALKFAAYDAEGLRI